MSDSTNLLILKTLENYRLACQKPVAIALKSSGEYIDELLHYFLQMQMETCLSNSDQLLLRWSANFRAQGLLATHREEFTSAEEFFAKARAHYESGSLSPEGNLLYKSFQEPAEAYLDYRRGDFAQAHKRLLEALASDAVLEDEYGYDFLFIHRIHLVVNIVRITVRNQHFYQAVELACQLLSYLQGKSENLSIPLPWGAERVALLPEDIFALMFTQVIHEIALILTGKNSQIVNELFAIVTHNLQFQVEDNFFLFPQVREWLLIKQAFILNDFASFLELASSFLTQRRSDSPLLWYAVVIDLLAVCDECKFPDADLVKQEVSREALNCEYLPKQFFSYLDIHANFEKDTVQKTCLS
jgi:hypothetical protein